MLVTAVSPRRPDEPNLVCMSRKCVTGQSRGCSKRTAVAGADCCSNRILQKHGKCCYAAQTGCTMSKKFLRQRRANSTSRLARAAAA